MVVRSTRFFSLRKRLNHRLLQAFTGMLILLYLCKQKSSKTRKRWELILLWRKRDKYLITPVIIYIHNEAVHSHKDENTTSAQKEHQCLFQSQLLKDLHITNKTVTFNCFSTVLFLIKYPAVTRIFKSILHIHGNPEN